jgi:2-haloacid dehalogenase
MLPIKALLFDVFGTVVDWRGSLIAEFEAFGAAHGVAADWGGLVDAWRAGYTPSLDRVRHGDLPWTKLDVLHRMTLDALLPRFGLDALDEAARDELNLGWHRLHGWPDAAPGLARLRRRFILAPLSNGNVSLLIDMAKAAGLPWDAVFGADLFEHYKPDPQTYLGACALLDLPPSQVMLVAAHNYDLKAALALGLRTAFIPRPTEYGPGQTRDLRAEGPWYVVADDLEDLAERLGC